jgi:hypothetical protein
MICFWTKINLVIDAKFVIRELKVKATTVVELGYNPEGVKSYAFTRAKGPIV